LALYRVVSNTLDDTFKFFSKRKPKNLGVRDIQTEKQKNYFAYYLLSDHSLALFVSVVAICRFVVCTSCVAFSFPRDYFTLYNFVVFI